MPVENRRTKEEGIRKERSEMRRRV